VEPSEHHRSPRLNSAEAAATKGLGRLQGTVLWSMWERVLEVEFLDRSIALAGKAFVSFFPLVIVVAAFLPIHLRNAVLSTMTHRLGIHGEASNLVKGAFANSSQIRKATGFLGLLLTVVYASSFTTALRRMYLRVWRRPPTSMVSAYIAGAVWVAMCIGYMALVGGVRSLLGGNPLGLATFSLLALIGSGLFWAMTTWFALGKQVRLRALLPTGALTGIATLAYSVAAQWWMPQQMSSNEAQFGFFGIALAFVTWLSGISVCLVVCAAIGAELTEAPGAIGRIGRMGLATVLVDGATPTLPAPTRTNRRPILGRVEE
jgi:membrane protein